MILRHTVVCHLHRFMPQQSPNHVYFQFEKDGHDEREGVYLTKKVWTEMGRPATVTVTVEAGDHIGEEETHQQNLLDKIPSRLPHVPMTPLGV